jgi:hypothetical protein
MSVLQFYLSYGALQSSGYALLLKMRLDRATSSLPLQGSVSSQCLGFRDAAFYWARQQGLQQL